MKSLSPRGSASTCVHMAPSYLCELYYTRPGTDHHQHIIPPIIKDCSNTFLELSLMYAAPCEWNKLSEHIRTLHFVSRRVLKQCYLHNNMDADCKCIYFFELEDFIMINRQKHYTKYLHDKLETKDIRCI